MNFRPSYRSLLVTIIALCLMGVPASAAKHSSHKSASAKSTHSSASHAKVASKASTKDSAKSSSKKTSAKAAKSDDSDSDAKPVASGKKKGKRGKGAAVAAAPRRPRGQQGIDGDRAREIQSALIREHYLDGEPTGVWDSRTKDALVRFQGDHGWQTRITPDSRALIKLGLGPRHDGLLNPEAAAIAPVRPADRTVSEVGGERSISGIAMGH